MAQTPYSLLDRIGHANKTADWDRLVALYSPLLRTWLRKQVPQEADIDDIVQDVLAVVVAKLPEFRHNGSDGAFRSWLRAILAFRLKSFWRQRQRLPVAGGDDRCEQFLRALEEPDGDLARRWDEEHDRFIAARLLEQIRSEFTPATWNAFHCYVIDGRSPADVAMELGVSTNVVFIARSRVLRRLREEARGLIDPGDTLPPSTQGP